MNCQIVQFQSNSKLFRPCYAKLLNLSLLILQDATWIVARIYHKPTMPSSTTPPSMVVPTTTPIAIFLTTMPHFYLTTMSTVPFYSPFLPTATTLLLLPILGYFLFLGHAAPELPCSSLHLPDDYSIYRLPLG